MTRTAIVRRAGAASTAALALLLTLFAPALAWADEDDGGRILVEIPERDRAHDREITDAQLRWAINDESGSGAFAGGCNFLSAGVAGDTGGGGIVWTDDPSLYRAEEGSARIEKPDAAGEYRTASWDERCLDPLGQPVSSSSLSSASGNQVVIDGGSGWVALDGAVELVWRGSFTVVFYGGMSYWSVTDPVLSIDANGDGRLMATASGYGSSMDDLSKWEPLPERDIVLAELRGVDTTGGQGFVTDPLYLGVEARDAGQVPRTPENASHWGAFPASFLDYQKLTGQTGYWLSTGGQRDPAKVPRPVYVSYDTSDPVTVRPAPAGDSIAPVPRNVIRERPEASTVSSVAPARNEFPTAVPAATPVLYPLADFDVVLPAELGLVPEAIRSLSPLLVPLLVTAAALGLAIVSVLNIMQVLPWQRRRS